MAVRRLIGKIVFRNIRFGEILNNISRTNFFIVFKNNIRENPDNYFAHLSNLHASIFRGEVKLENPETLTLKIRLSLTSKWIDNQKVSWSMKTGNAWSQRPDFPITASKLTS